MKNDLPFVRGFPEAKLHEAVNAQLLELYFQKSPGRGLAPDQGIADLEYEIRIGGKTTQTGKTGKDGLIKVIALGPEIALDLRAGGKTVASYKLIWTSDALEAPGTVAGRQRRLRLLGYQIGHGGADGTGVDGAVGGATERSTLDFQVDHGLAADADIGTNTQKRLVKEAGA